MSRRTMSWPAAIVVAAAATAIAMLLQNLARALWQVRTLPERVMEWVLLFVPLDLFEQGLERFGANAKEMALTGAIAGMALILFVLALIALRRGWSGATLLLVAVVLWLVAMAGIMPLTGAGLFATGLFQPPLVVNAAFALVTLAYVAVLALGQVVWTALASRQASANASPAVTPASRAARRAFLVGLGGAVAAYAVARFAGSGGSTPARTDLPLATLPTPKPRVAAAGATRPTPPAAPPSPSAMPASALVPAGTSGAAPQVATGKMTPVPSAASQPTAPAAVPTPAALPTPPPARQLARDKDGSLTAGARAPGTLAEALTPDDNFYVVTKNAAGDPVVDPSTWRLVIEGEVEHPVQLDYATLRALPAVEVTKTLECISNFTAECQLTAFGCELISTARWKGVPLPTILELAGGLKPTAAGLAVLSVDEFSAGLPIEVARDPHALVVYEMNGQVLPYEHGYPARLLVPGRYGMKNPKWLAAIRPMDREYLGYYEQRNWNKDGIVKTMSRIDVPAPGATLPAGPQRIAGVAYAGARGVQKVEFSADGGQTWQEARFVEPAPGADAWVRWEGSFTLAPGSKVKLVSRATDGTGAVQTDVFSLPQPDGGSGRDTIEVAVA